MSLRLRPGFALLVFRAGFGPGSTVT